MPDSVVEILLCVACGASKLETFFDFGSQPLANSFPTEPEQTPRYPLAVNYCPKCSHVQLTHSVDRSLLFKNYLYASGTTATLKKDFEEFAKELTDKHGPGRILDIACNDGSQLNEFKKLGWETWGIDPAQNLFEISSLNHNVIPEFLNSDHPARLGKFDVILAQNVLAHTDDPLNFLEITRHFGGTIYIQTSQAQMIRNFQFDTIYHEHISFFSEASMDALATRAGLAVLSVSNRAIHGGSFLFELGLPNNKSETPARDFVARNEIEKFAERTTSTISKIKELLTRLQDQGIEVIGYGAAAKGMTVLSATGAKLKYIIDDSELKQNRFTPDGRTRIVSIEHLKTEGNTIYLMPLAWNFADEIRARVKLAHSGDVKLIKYFPEVTLN